MDVAGQLAFVPWKNQTWHYLWWLWIQPLTNVLVVLGTRTAIPHAKVVHAHYAANSLGVDGEKSLE